MLNCFGSMKILETIYLCANECVMLNIIKVQCKFQSDGAIEYTDCISAERQDSANECHGYSIKLSDSKAPVTIVITPRSTLAALCAHWL